MDSSLILWNVLNSSVLLFLIGLTAVFLKSDFEILQQIPKLFSLCLWLAIAAVYGLISKVSYLAASSFLSWTNVDFEKHRVTCLMALPMGIVLMRVFANQRALKSTHKICTKNLTRAKCRRHLRFKRFSLF